MQVRKRWRGSGCVDLDPPARGGDGGLGLPQRELGMVALLAQMEQDQVFEAIGAGTAQNGPNQFRRLGV